MNVLEIQTLACGAWKWFQQALIRLCVCAAVALLEYAVMDVGGAARLVEGV